MPLITGCRLYVDETLTTVGYSLEEARRLAVPYIHNRQALKLESCVASLPTQVWAYDYDIAAWVLQRYMVKDNLTTDLIPTATAAIGIAAGTSR
jgi:hypothetical protein